MNRLLISLTVVLGILMWTSNGLERRREARRIQESTFTSLGKLKNVTIDKISHLEVRIGTQTESWRYSLCDAPGQKAAKQSGVSGEAKPEPDKVWQYPGYFNAYVEASKIQALMGSALNVPGTKIVRRQGYPHYGLNSEKAVKLTFLDDKDKSLLEAWVGKVIAGRSANASYMKIAKERDIYLIHTNPHYLLALPPASPAPMIDRRVFPGALGRRNVSKVIFRGRKGYSLKDLFRVEIEEEEDDEKKSPRKMPGGLEGPRIEWHGHFGGKKEVFLASNVRSYIGFLSQLRYKTIVDPASAPAKNFRAVKGRIVLEDSEDEKDTLEVGGNDGKGGVYIRNRITGQVFTVTANKAQMLFPTRSILMNKITGLSPYIFLNIPQQ